MSFSHTLAAGKGETLVYKHTGKSNTGLLLYLLQFTFLQDLKEIFLLCLSIPYSRLHTVMKTVTGLEAFHCQYFNSSKAHNNTMKWRDSEIIDFCSWVHLQEELSPQEAAQASVKTYGSSNVALCWRFSVVLGADVTPQQVECRDKKKHVLDWCTGVHSLNI